LVEGQGDVIRLHEAGVRNAVGIFGSHLSDSQVFLLQKSGALNIIVMTDNDEAGEKCRLETKEKLKYSFNIFDVITPTNDIGDMSVGEINEIIKPQMKGLF
jgi:DNA primase